MVSTQRAERKQIVPAITPESPLADRVKWLFANGVVQFGAGIALIDGKRYGAIVFNCSDPNCLNEHILDTFSTEDEARDALEMAVESATGRKIQDGGIMGEA